MDTVERERSRVLMTTDTSPAIIQPSFLLHNKSEQQMGTLASFRDTLPGPGNSSLSECTLLEWLDVLLGVAEAQARIFEEEELLGRDMAPA